MNTMPTMNRTKPRRSARRFMPVECTTRRAFGRNAGPQDAHQVGIPDEGTGTWQERWEPVVSAGARRRAARKNRARSVLFRGRKHELRLRSERDEPSILRGNACLPDHGAPAEMHGRGFAGETCPERCGTNEIRLAFNRHGPRRGA